MREQVNPLRYFKTSFIFTAFFLFIELYIWWEYILGEISFGVLLGLHILLTILSVGLLFFFVKIGWGIRLIMITTLFLALMGPFGAAMSLSIIILYGSTVFFVDPIAGLMKMLMPSITKTKSEEHYDRIQYGMENYDISADPIPLHEVVKFGSVKQKLSAIEKMLRFYHPEFIPVLKLALADSNNSVRVMAATAISSLEDRFHKVYVELENKYTNDPEDPDIILALADHCYEYAHAAVFDENRLNKMKRIAAGKYEEYLKFRPGNGQALMKAGQLYFELGDYDSAENAVKKLSESDETLTRDVYILLMRIYYEKKEFSRMHRLTGGHYVRLSELAEAGGYHEFEDVLFAWGGASVAAKFLEDANG